MNNILLLTLILTFITYWLTNLLVYQDGPFDIFIKIRRFFGIYDEEDGDIIIDTERFAIFNHNLFGGILSCPYCTNVWVSLIVGASILPFINIEHEWLSVLAAMGLHVILLDFKNK